MAAENFRMKQQTGGLYAQSPAVFATQVILVVGACGLLAWLPSILTRAETTITTYSAPKEIIVSRPDQQSSSGEPAHLWGAIVPLKADVWFFKLTGPVEEVKALDTSLRDFLRTINWESGEPDWTLPEGWQQKPGNEFRFATIVLPSEQQPLELAVSKLGRSDEDWNDQLLANLNRWLGQLSLPPINKDEIAASTESLEVSGVTATIVSVTGVKKPETMGRGPFSGGR